VLTPDFAYVMGGRDSKDFRIFCDKCCKGYNILRKHSSMFINLFCMVRTARSSGRTPSTT
jgi:phosphatidylinositol-4,5-bisphosphate 3-kinase